MANSQFLLAIVVGLAVGFADRFAHHDELAARRFRELDPRIVGTDLDRSRNRRWHRAGTWVRGGVVGILAAAAGLYLQSVLAVALAALVAGSVVSLLFDIFFNKRFGLDWDYVGTTAWLDETLNRFGVRREIKAGRWAAALELTGVVVGCLLWQKFL